MPDISEQLRIWSQSLADSVAPADIKQVVTPPFAPDGSSHGRRWLAAAASLVFVVAGIVGIAALSNDGPDRNGPVTDVPDTTNEPDSTTADPPNTTPPDPTVSTPPTAAPNATLTTSNGVDIADAFGDVAGDSLAVTSDGRIVTATGTQLRVLDVDGEVSSIDLPDGIVARQVWVGTDDIAVASGTDRGVEVDLRTGSIVSQLTRDGDVWTRTDPTPADTYTVVPGRPNNPLGLGLLIDSGTQLPEVEGAGCFETLSDQSQSWSIERPTDCSAFVDEIAPLADGGYLVTLRAATDESSSTMYPYVLRVDGTIENLDPIDGTVDVQPGPNGLTVLTVNDATASISTIPQ